MKSLPDPRPRFHLKLGWTKDYESLFAGSFSSTSDVSEVLNRIKNTGRILLTGRGGGAKTAIVNRLAREAVSSNIVPIILSLKKWSGGDYDLWDRHFESSSKINFLLQRFALTPVTSSDLDSLPTDMPRLLLLDGLNEVESRIGQELIYILDEFARYAINTNVLVTDRLVRRDFIRPPRWQLALVLPLSDEEVRKHLDARRGRHAYERLSQDAKVLLKTPYFLNASIRNGAMADSRSAEMREYFLAHGAITAPELDLAARAAFDVYGGSARTFETVRFEGIAGQAVTRKLRQSGALQQSGPLSYFDHHLKHDYLAARHLIGNPDLWNAETFERITFNASSFETIMFAVEQIEDPGQADLFVRRVYDWNLYGVGYALSEARNIAVTNEMQNVILAMFAERKWDVIESTANRALDTLALIPRPEAKQYLDAADMPAVFALVEGVHSERPWFNEWKALFTMDPQREGVAAPIEMLRNDDSVLGWTSSNVLKRLHLSGDTQARLVELLHDNNEVARWRVAHVLGSFPSEANVNALIGQLTDIRRVRFGAVRSLVEMAAYSERALVQRIFDQLKEQTTAIAEFRGVADEFLRAVFVREKQVPDLEWLQFVFPVVKALQQSSSDETRAQYERASQRLVERYGRTD